jgi:hypothetical protein
VSARVTDEQIQSLVAAGASFPGDTLPEVNPSTD